MQTNRLTFSEVGVNRYRLEKTPAMRVNAVFYAKKELLNSIQKDRSLTQLAQAAQLPSLLDPVIGMPDIHEGFGLPIGGVMAAQNLVSAAAVGMDINCGVRFLASELTFDPKIFTPETLQHLMAAIESKVPTGVGSKTKTKLPGISFKKVVTEGAAHIVRQGYGEQEDLERIEEGGCLAGADLEVLSQRARDRAQRQLGTLGSGNHFIEIQRLAKIFDAELAGQFGLFENQIGVMIHTGSRALGHQTCVDYSRLFLRKAAAHQIPIPAPNLAALPADSSLGREYLAAMAGAVNFAFANRQLIADRVREVFRDEARLLGAKDEKNQLHLVYDVAHNIAKWEEHRAQRVLVHRKGATRALPAGHRQNPPVYKTSGHPVVIPGSMGTASYILVGTKKAQETFYSVNHGSGRIMSRGEAQRTIKEASFAASMRGIVHNKPFRVIADEAPEAYKDIDLVVETLTEAGLVKKVARLKPLAVIKGD